MTKLLSSSRRVVFALRMKVFTNNILEHYSQTIFKKSVCILRASSRQKFKLTGPRKECVCIICRLFRHLSTFVPLCNVETPKSNWQSKHKSLTVTSSLRLECQCHLSFHITSANILLHCPFGHGHVQVLQGQKFCQVLLPKSIQLFRST